MTMKYNGIDTNEQAIKSIGEKKNDVERSQFAGYSSDSLAERILDSKAKVLITTDGVWRGEKLLLLKNICDEMAIASKAASLLRI